MNVNVKKVPGPAGAYVDQKHIKNICKEIKFLNVIKNVLSKLLHTDNNNKIVTVNHYTIRIGLLSG